MSLRFGLTQASVLITGLNFSPGLRHARSLIVAIPFSVIGSEKDVQTNDGCTVKGRQYTCGVAEVENEEHC